MIIKEEELDDHQGGGTQLTLTTILKLVHFKWSKTHVSCQL